MKKYFYQLVVMVAVVSSLAACSKKDDSDGGATRVSGRGSGSVVGTNNAAQAGMYGKLYADGVQVSSTTFNSSLAAFLSASIDPRAFGTVSSSLNSNTGVYILGTFRHDGNGNINTGESTLDIEVYDSYSAQGQVQPYRMAFPNAASGRLSNGVLTITFSDAYGDVTIQAQRQTNGYYTGWFQFTNKQQAVSGYARSGYFAVMFPESAFIK